MGRVCCIAIATGLGAIACTPDPLRSVYVFEASYGEAIVTPAGLQRGLAGYAAPICGDGHEVLDRAFVGEPGPRHVRVTFGCR